MDTIDIVDIVEEIRNLIENKKINKLHDYLETINSADLPSILDEFDEENTIMIYRLLSKGKAAEVFVDLDPDDKEKLIGYLTDTEIKNVMNEIYMDEAVDLIEEMPSNVVKRILANTKPQNRKIINELLKYPDDTAGSMMTTEFIDLKENMTVKQAFEFIKEKGLKKETVYNCYVLSIDRKLLGVIDIKALLIADRNMLVQDIMDTNVIKAYTLEDQEEVAKLFDRYDCIAVPVVDKEERLVGIITIDDAIDVMQEETLEDFEKMAAIAPAETSYFKTSVFKHAKNRIVWLFILMISAMVTGAIIENFETAISSLPLLVAFIPMIMGTGGNCGSQSSTLIIRGLAMDEICTKDLFKAMWKEFRVALLVGLTLGIVNTARIVIQYQDIKIAVVVSVTLMFTVIIAKLLGCMLPIAAKKLKLDPAIMASPLLTTIVDTVSVLLFFTISTAVFHL
ncbi:MAG TPA: magnesium transporter [Candidatus Scatovivens faecipullorum]|nr:magnesium transporter [Candidatus Scatovivens faecipullorum]